MSDAFQKLRQEMGGNRVELPFPIVRVNQSEGTWHKYFDNEESKKVGASIKFFPFARYAQYMAFDRENKIKHRTTIEKDVRECIDIITGMNVQELKETLTQDKRLVYFMYLLSFLIHENKIEPVVISLKGILTSNYINFLSEQKDYKKKKEYYALTMKLKGEKKGAVNYFSAVIDKEPLTEDIAELIANDMRLAKEKYEQYRLNYNKAKISSKQETIEAKDIENDIIITAEDDDDINF